MCREEKRGFFFFFSRRHLALVKRGSEERPVFAICFDWADWGEQICRSVVLF